MPSEAVTVALKRPAVSNRVLRELQFPLSSLTRIQHSTARLVLHQRSSRQLRRRDHLESYRDCWPPASKDLAHQHRFCPSGPTSWCKWQKDKVCGTRTYTGKNCLPPCFLPLLKPTFLRLCDNALLTRVLDGYTQNPNESLHAVIWKKCPKHIFRGPRTVKIAVATGVMQFNAGYHSLLSTMEECGLPVMENSKKFAITKDTRRVQDADRKQTQQWKSQRQRLRAQKKHLEEELIESEGVTYEAGAF